MSLFTEVVTIIRAAVDVLVAYGRKFAEEFAEAVRSLVAILKEFFSPEPSELGPDRPDRYVGVITAKGDVMVLDSVTGLAYPFSSSRDYAEALVVELLDEIDEFGTGNYVSFTADDLDPEDGQLVEAVLAAHAQQ